MKNGTAPLKNGTVPHHLASQGASPRGDAAKRLSIFAEENFVSKILCRQGEAAKRLTIFVSLCVGTMRQGEAVKRLTIFVEKMKAPNFFQARGRYAKTSSVGRSRQLPRRGSRERGLSIKRLFDEKMPDCCSAAPHHLALQGAGCRSCLKRQFGKKSPPRGSRETRVEYKAAF